MKISSDWVPDPRLLDIWRTYNMSLRREQKSHIKMYLGVAAAIICSFIPLFFAFCGD